MARFMAPCVVCDFQTATNQTDLYPVCPVCRALEAGICIVCESPCSTSVCQYCMDDCRSVSQPQPPSPQHGSMQATLPPTPAASPPPPAAPPLPPPAPEQQQHQLIYLLPPPSPSLSLTHVSESQAADDGMEVEGPAAAADAADAAVGTDTAPAAAHSPNPVAESLEDEETVTEPLSAAAARAQNIAAEAMLPAMPSVPQ
jgi:hypothetical protein